MENKVKQKIGKRPGTLIYTGHELATETRLELVKYDPEGYVTEDYNSIGDALDSFDKKKINWLKVKGFTDVKLIAELGESLKIHSLVLEDILNVQHLPKIEVFDEFIFITLKMLSFNEEKQEISRKHVSFILGDHYLISFQEHTNEDYKTIHDRIASTNTKVKQRKADYLLYYLMDLIVDQYYFVFDKLNQKVEQLEIDVLNDHTTNSITDIIQLKNTYSELRKNIEPIAELLREFKKSETALADDYVIPYFNDIADHIKQYLETIKTKHESLASLTDLSMSILSTRMNKVMYILTIVMTIFVPLTFIAGLYGMNFTYIPELEFRYGYFVVLGVMTVLGVGILIYMKRKRWF